MEYENNDLVTAASLQMKAEVYRQGGSCLQGVLYSKYLETPYEFSDFMGLIGKMEEVFDSKGFPEVFMMPRTFELSTLQGKNQEEDRDKTMKNEMTSIIRPELNSSKCTFEITVKFRQNATWQGQILWAEKNQKQNFRSVLEMLKLMDGALEYAEGSHESISWDSDE